MTRAYTASRLATFARKNMAQAEEDGDLNAFRVYRESYHDWSGVVAREPYGDVLPSDVEGW